MLADKILAGKKCLTTIMKGARRTLVLIVICFIVATLALRGCHAEKFRMGGWLAEYGDFDWIEKPASMD